MVYYNHRMKGVVFMYGIQNKEGQWLVVDKWINVNKVFFYFNDSDYNRLEFKTEDEAYTFLKYKNINAFVKKI